jgi:hypothetical protein
LSTGEKDWSDFPRQLSNITGALSLLCGFTFTGFTILLTRLQNPTEVSSQITLFFVSGLFNLFLLLLEWSIVIGNYWLKTAPQRTKGLIIYYFLAFLGMGLWGMVIPLMLSLWNLTFLAWASGFVSVLFFAVFCVFIYRPYWKFRKTQSRSSQTP